MCPVEGVLLPVCMRLASIFCELILRHSLSLAASILLPRGHLVCWVREALLWDRRVGFLDSDYTYDWFGG